MASDSCVACAGFVGLPILIILIVTISCMIFGYNSVDRVLEITGYAYELRLSELILISPRGSLFIIPFFGSLG